MWGSQGSVLGPTLIHPVLNNLGKKQKIVIRLGGEAEIFRVVDTKND